MREMLDFAWGDLIKVWAKSAAVTLAAVTPALASYALWHGPQQAGATQVFGSGPGDLVNVEVQRHVAIPSERQCHSRFWWLRKRIMADRVAR